MTLQDLKIVNSYLKSCFLIFPNYNLGHGLMEMAYNEYLNEYYAKIGEGRARGHRAPSRWGGGQQACGWGRRVCLAPEGGDVGGDVGGRGGSRGPGPELLPHRPV